MPLPPAKEVLTEAEAGASGIFRLWLRVMKVLETQDKHARLIEAQAAQIEALRDAVHLLQAREELLLAKMQAEAARATSDLASRIGFSGRTRQPRLGRSGSVRRPITYPLAARSSHLGAGAGRSA